MAGRPTKIDALRRTARYLELAGRGVPLDEAAKQAGVDPWRALRLASDPDFRDHATRLAEAA